jgi:hypothetical protein
MLRRIAAIVILSAGVASFLVTDGSRPYPYPVAYKFAYQYREESLKEENWQGQFQALHPYASTGRLTRFWPAFADTPQGALECWMKTRKTLSIPYFHPGTMAPRRPTTEETALEQEGWVAGYMESVRQHPRTSHQEPTESVARTFEDTGHAVCRQDSAHPPGQRLSQTAGLRQVRIPGALGLLQDPRR